MSHVDEGMIHAYLDGAFAGDVAERTRIELHIAECDACRSAVDAERRIRDRAAAVLEHAVPDVMRIEPFEQILAARAGTTAGAGRADTPDRATAGGGDTVENGIGNAGPAPVSRWRFRMPLTLAATLVLAVTAGLFARQYLPRGTRQAEELLEPQSKPETARRLDAVTSSTSPAEAVSPAGAGRSVAPTTPPRPADAGAADDKGPGSGKVVQSNEMVTGAGSARAAGRAANEPPPAAAPPPVSRDLQTRPADETRRLADSALRRERAPASAAALAPAVAADVDVTINLAGMLRSDVVVWAPVDPDTIATRLGGTPISLPDMVPDSVQVASVSAATVLRFVYRINGQPVELLEWVAGSLPAGRDGRIDNRQLPERSGQAEPKATPPMSSAVYRLGGLEFVLRGPLPADSLAALSRRVR